MKPKERRIGRRTAPAMLLAAATLFAPLTMAQDEERFVSLMTQYLSLAGSLVETAERPEAAVFMAIEGIFEVYEQRRDAPNAVKHFERLLAKHGDNRTVRNLIRFKLRDIYKETGQQDKALEQLDLIFAENAAAAQLASGQ